MGSCAPCLAREATALPRHRARARYHYARRRRLLRSPTVPFFATAIHRDSDCQLFEVEYETQFGFWWFTTFRNQVCHTAMTIEPFLKKANLLPSRPKTCPVCGHFFGGPTCGYCGRTGTGTAIVKSTRQRAGTKLSSTKQR